MADIKEAIRRLIYQYTVEGADKVVATQQAVAATTTTTDKAALSLEKSFGNLERRYISTVRQQQDYQKVQERVNAAVAQNPALQERANAVLAAAEKQYGQTANAQKAFAVATSGVSAQLTALAAGAGPVGTFLSALGPWGIAAAVGLGAVTAVFDRLDEGAKRIGDKSIELKKFSDVTGLSVTEIKGLTKAGAELGVSSDDITTSIERFSVGLFEARTGSGALFDQVNKINPALARQLAEATSTAQGWDILAQAIKGATDAAQRNALARAAFGRGGIETGLVAAATVEKGGVAAMGEQIAKNTGLTREWVNETARLRQENIALEKAITATTDAAFALPMLQRQNEYLKGLKEAQDLLYRTGKLLPQNLAEPGTEGMIVPSAFLIPAAPPPSQRGPSEGAMQAQQEAAAQREVTKAIEDANKARDYALSVEKMLVTIAQNTAEDEMRKAAVFAENAKAYPNVSAKTAQTLAALNDQLKVASAIGGAAQIEAQHRATINDLLRQGKSWTDASAIADEQRAITLAKIEAAHQVTMVALQGQLSVAQQITGIGQINAQYEANITNLKMQGLNTSQATAQADMQRAIALAQVNAEADRTLKSLQQENELLKAGSEFDKDRIKARQTYQDLIDKGVDSEKARAVASQQLANADYQRAQREREEADKLAESTRQRVKSYKEAADAAQREADQLARVAEAARRAAQEIMKFVPFGTSDSLMAPYVQGKNIFQSNQGGMSQFNPAGYTSSTPFASTLNFWATSRYGTSGFDPTSGAPNAQGIQKVFNQELSRAGGDFSKLVSNMLGGDLTSGPIMGGAATLDMNMVGLLNRAIEILPKDQQISSYQREVGMLQQQGASLETSELIKQLNDKLAQLTQATDANTSATSTMTDVLSPFYSSDPRNTHLGFRAFAGGGIMSRYGELPIRHYQGGGMATSPQVAVFGEGSTPEAYVPVPSGRIPVELKGANSNQRQRPIVVNINVQGNADQNTVSALRSTAFQQAQAMRRMM